MARLSPITLTLAAIMIAVLGGTIFLLVHSRQSRPAPEEVETAAEPAPPAPAPRAPEIAPPPPTPAPPPAAPAEAVAEAPPEVDAQAPGDETPPPAPSRRALLVVNHNRRTQEADESVFSTLALPDSTRASIRQINDDYRRRTEAGADAGTTLGAADAAAALKARQDALTSLLGTDSAKSFDAEERMAVMRLRGKYRYEWGRQLRQ